MKLVEVNWQPTDRQLRQFGITCLAALPFFGWIWGAGSAVIVTLVVVGLLLTVVGLTVPAALKPLFLALTILFLPIGLVVGEIALLVIYFGVFLPIGLVFRLIGRDALQRRLERDQQSYWEEKPRPSNISSYYRQS